MVMLLNKHSGVKKKQQPKTPNKTAAPDLSVHS